MKKNKLNQIAVWSYAFAQGSGYQIAGSIVGAYLMIFLTDTFKVPVAAVSLIMVLASVWDAINDPMMGALADRTKSRWGRYRVYLLFVPIPLMFVTIALFSSPNLTDTGKIIWTAIFYVAYGMLRTAMEIPCGALINAVTDEEKERNRMISAYTLVMGIFTTLSTSFALAWVSFFGGDNTAKGYMIIMALAGVLMTASCWICVASTKENFVIEKKERPLRTEIKELVHVKGLFPVIATWLASFIAYNMMMSSSVYYLMYYICRPDLISVYMLDISLVGLLGIAAGLPILMKITRRVDRAFSVSQIFVFICSLIILFAGHNLALLFILSGLSSFFATMSMAFNSILMTEMTDLIYYRNHTMMNGIMAALKGFSNKCGIAITNGVLGAVLAATGYIAGAVGGQSAATMQGINLVRFAVPMVMALVILICLRFYPVTNEQKKNFENLYQKQEEETESEAQ